ncbi:hypothetical protein D3C73_173300 [compost metagenome]|jgi:hypothetical protein
MSINQEPVGAILLDNYEAIEEAIFDGTGFHASEGLPNDLADVVHRFTENGDNVAFVDPNHEEYVELIIRIPRT